MHHHKSVEFHQCHFKRHSSCFYHNIKDNERKLYQDLLTTENTDSDLKRCIMQMSYLYASDFPFKTFCKLAQNAEKYEKMFRKRVVVVDKSTDHDKTHINLFFTTISTPKKMIFFVFFFSARELKKVLRDTLTRAGMNSYRQGPSNFSLIRFEHAHASYRGLFFSPSRVQPLYGAGRKEGSGTGLVDFRMGMYHAYIRTF